MPTIDHNRPRGECESCRALHVWREKSRDLEKRLEIAEKAALACPKPLVWTSEPPKVPGEYWLRYKSAGRTAWSPTHIIPVLGVMNNCSIPEEWTVVEWAGPIPEPKEQGRHDE